MLSHIQDSIRLISEYKMLNLNNKKFKLFITFVLLLLALFSITKYFDNYGERYTDEGFQRSLAAFAIAKGLNGAISVIQGTEVAVEPVGVGLTLTPGQVLDPANDLIERFSWIMLICTTSLGIQSILINIFSSIFFSITVAVFLCLITYFLWTYRNTSANLQNILYRSAVILIILRFFIPTMAITSDLMYKAFLENKYSESKNELEKTDKAITELSKDEDIPEDETQEISWYESITSSISSAFESLNIDNRVELLKVEAENLTNHIISLIVVFTIQTILFPLLFIWLSVKLLKATLSFRFIQSI